MVHEPNENDYLIQLAFNRKNDLQTEEEERRLEICHIVIILEETSSARFTNGGLECIKRLPGHKFL